MAETNSGLPASVIHATDKPMESSIPTEPSLTTLTLPAKIIPHPDSPSLSISENLKIVDPSSPSSKVPTNKRPNGEQGQNLEVTEGSAIVATDSVVAVVPIEEKNIVTIFVVCADSVLQEIISQKNEVQGMGTNGPL